jgi:hypothetical protein
MDRLVGIADDGAHRGARHGMRLEAPGGRGRPLVGVVAGLIEGDGAGVRCAGDHAQGLRQAGGGVVGRGVEGRQQLGQILVQPFAPREGGGHPVHAPGDGPELVGLILGDPLAEVPLGDAFQRGDHAAERRGQPAAVVPEAEAKDGEHRDEQHRRGYRRLHGVVAGVSGELLQCRHAGRERGGSRQLPHPLEALRQFDHRRLGGARALPRRDLGHEADECHGDEGRREQAGDAGGGAHGAP